MCCDIGGADLFGICYRFTGYELCILFTVACFTDCVHRCHHVTEYIIVAIATVLQNRKEDSRYSYGYGRHEYLLVFTINLSAIIVPISSSYYL